jgi:membrane associated rhomboid family serine protease
MVIPVHDRNPARRTGWVNYAIILANIVVFVLSPLSGLNPNYGTDDVSRACAQELYFRTFGAIPAELLANQQLAPSPVEIPLEGGRSIRCQATPPQQKLPVLSVLFAMFMHGGWLHLLGNMLFLFVFGNNVEDRMGHLNYLAFYVGVGYLATYAFAFLYAGSTTTLVGASGAVAGVLGAYLYLYPRAKVIALFFFVPLRFPAWAVLGAWFLLQWLYFQGAGITGDTGTAYFAHVAGFIGGFLYAMFALGREEPNEPYRPTYPPPSPPPGPSGWPPRR